jgi:hypothetical protein
MAPERIDLLERDVQAHARSITEFTVSLAGVKDTLSDIEKDRAVEEIKDVYLEKRLSGIESRIDAVYKLGLWVLAAFGSSAIALIANFFFKGGLAVGP